MLQIGDRTLRPKLVILDKDGTLMAFDVIWHTWYQHLLNVLRDTVPWGAALQGGLDATLGVDAARDVWDPLGPLTLASTREVGLLIAGQLYRHTSLTWPEALQATRQAEDRARAALDSEDLVQPIGDLVALCQRLRQAGCLLAIATTDDREATERNLATLGIAAYFDALICGDDPVALKPAPDMVLRLCSQLGVEPQEAIMVGDTIADMDMAHTAGCLCAVGVGTGAVPLDMLAPFADVVIPDVHAIQTIREG